VLTSATAGMGSANAGALASSSPMLGQPSLMSLAAVQSTGASAPGVALPPEGSQYLMLPISIEPPAEVTWISVRRRPPLASSTTGVLVPSAERSRRYVPPDSSRAENEPSSRTGAVVVVPSSRATVIAATAAGKVL
jgi:hypothetical protein